MFWCACCISNLCGKIQKLMNIKRMVKRCFKADSLASYIHRPKNTVITISVWSYAANDVTRMIFLYSKDYLFKKSNSKHVCLLVYLCVNIKWYVLLIPASAVRVTRFSHTNPLLPTVMQSVCVLLQSSKTAPSLSEPTSSILQLEENRLEGTWTNKSTKIRWRNQTSLDFHLSNT